MRKLFKRIINIFFAVVLIAAAFACSDSWAEGKVRIMASLFPYYDIAKTIGGSRADVKLLIKPGADQHSFEPTTGQIKSVCDSDIFLYTADNMEVWADKILSGANKDIKIIRITDYLEDFEQNGGHGNHDHDDPHIWLFVPNMIAAAQAIRDALIEVDPKGAEYYTQNAQALIQQLNDLHEDFAQSLSGQNQKKLIFAGHFAYRVMLEGYGIENYLTLYEGVTDDEDIKLKNMRDIIDAMVVENITAIYVDYYDPNPAPANQIAASVKAKNGGQDIKMLRLHTLANLSKTDFKGGVTYIDLMRHNLDMLKEGLK